ncbi:MAG: TonB-dependent receptor, partial [Phenylobacterium sp.]
MKSKIALACAGSVVALAAAVAVPAQAQTENSSVTTLDDVVVTARKREETLQTVPVAVSAYSAVQLERQNIRDATDLGRYTPSLRTTQASNVASMVIYN